MHWMTLFDISQTNYWSDWILALAGIALIPVFTFFSLRKSAIIGLLQHKRISLDEKKLQSYIAIWRMMGGCAAIIAVAVILLSFNSHISSHNALTEVYKQGRCKQVDGIVTDFVPMPYDGHSNESFVVKGQQFHYSDYDLTNPGFKKTSSHGGPIRNGLHVQIWYYDNSIARLDVAKENKL